jgi:hypothetical protein
MAQRNGNTDAKPEGELPCAGSGAGVLAGGCRVDRVKPRRATEFMAKKCGVGKSCGASCVNSGKQCEVALRENVNTALDKVVDRILSHDAALKTPEAAVKWLEANKERLAGYGGGNWGDPKGELLILGIEPGDNPKEIYYDAEGKLLKRLEGLGADPTLQSEKWGEWYDRHPLVFANDIRQRYVVKQATRNLEKVDEGMALDGQALKRIGSGPDDLRKLDVKNFRKDAFLNQNNKPYVRKLVAMSKDTGWNGVLGLNVSPFGVPSDKYWPFEGLPFAESSVFRNRKSWMNFAANHSAKQIKSYVESSPRKVVYVAANSKVHQSVFKKLAKDYGQVPERKVLTWESSSGNKMEVEVNLFTTGPKGNRTVMVQTNHPSWTGWTAAALSDLNKMILDKQES